MQESRKVSQLGRYGTIQ
uniref:Uncharacterized protein n=1 Tax=Arundo donax TaxID=35708 RepID=A0A0A9BZ70_ARUDO